MLVIDKCDQRFSPYKQYRVATEYCDTKANTSVFSHTNRKIYFVILSWDEAIIRI